MINHTVLIFHLSLVEMLKVQLGAGTGPGAVARVFCEQSWPRGPWSAQGTLTWFPGKGTWLRVGLRRVAGCFLSVPSCWIKVNSRCLSVPHGAASHLLNPIQPLGAFSLLPVTQTPGSSGAVPVPDGSAALPRARGLRLCPTPACCARRLAGWALKNQVGGC